MEFGLCCLFYKELIKFKTYTYAGIKKLPKQEAWEKVIGIWKHNISTLQEAVNYTDLKDSASNTQLCWD